MIMTGKTKEQWETEKKEELSSSVRAKRNELLENYVDKINVIRYNTMKEKDRQAWAEYRQALLDVPQQEGFPHNITWPEMPKEERNK